jgi:hypothetical protein
LNSFEENHPILSRPKIIEDEKEAFVFLEGGLIEKILDLPY